MRASLSKRPGARQSPAQTVIFHATPYNSPLSRRKSGQGMDNDTTRPFTGQDLRRDRRFQVSQSAIITQPGHTEIACEIRDFCLGGLFLRFTNPEAAIASLAKRADAEVEVVFTPAATDNPRTFCVPAQLRRLSPLGVGVSFVRQPTEALRALQKLRMAGHRQKLAALPASAAHPQLREAGTTLLAETLQQVHDQMMRLIGDKLNAAAVQASGIAEHSGLLSAVHEFARQAAAVQARFVDQVLESLKQARPARAPAAAAPGSDLALVDELDFEDWLATSSEVNKLEEQFREQLADLEPRIGQLFGFSCDHSNNPFGPAVIGHAYRAALQDVQVPARARQVAYATLRDVLSEQLAPLYAELLALLPVAEIAPRTAHEPGRYPAAQTAQPGDVAASTAPPAGPSQGALSRMAGSLLDFFRGQPAAPSMPAASPMPAGVPAAAAGGDMAAPAPQGPALGVTHSPVLQRLAAAGALPPAVTHEMQRSVDMFGALFDSMHAEKSVTEGMKPFFHQLESSLIKLAMSDPSFLGSPAHPAHKVLNTLDRISMVAGDDGKIADQRLLRLMNRWTDRINAEAEKNPGVFEEARTQLERVVKPLLNERAARVGRLQEMCEGRQSAEVAKQRILRTLLARLERQPVPNPVIELLNGGWRNVLLIAEMRHGADSEAAREAWTVLDRLAAWLAPDRETAPLASDVQSLLQRIDQSLTQVCADKFAQDRIVDQLAAALFDQGSTQQTTIAARLDGGDAEPSSEAHDNLVERLRVGDWLKFKSLDAPLNLIWIGDQPHVYVFANYRGIKKLDLRRVDLLQSLENGEAEWTEDLELPLMDRSYSAMIQKMQRDLVWQAAHDPATGLANRKSFFRAVRRAWLRGQGGEAQVLGVVQFDILNPAGEAASAAVRTLILREISQLLPAQLPEGAQLARAGESGLAFWCEAADEATAQVRADAVLAGIAAHPQEIEGVRYALDPAVGLMWISDCLSPETYYDNANAACAAARETGVPIVAYRSETEDASGVLALAQWAHDLTRILADNQLDLNIQPVAAAADAARTALYYEVLLHPALRDAHRPIETHDLIDVAERLQRITEIDRWVVRRVLQWMRDHAGRIAAIGGFSIKLSGQSVVNPLFLRFVQSELARGDIPGNKLIFEISETDAVEGHAQTQLFMRQLQRYGCRFTLDEFGVGTSSYTSLKSMKLDYLKLDRALVREIATSMIDEALVRSILETGSFLGIKTVAGYVEDPANLDKLAEMGVDCVQGYLVGEPRPLESLA